MAKYFRVKQIHSAAGRLPRLRATIKALGFRHVGDTVELPDTPEVRGMIYKTQFLLDVVVVEGQLEKKANPVRKLRHALKKQRHSNAA